MSGDLESALAKLRDAIVGGAGGYLANTLAIPNVTCEVCRSPIEAQYVRCYPCLEHVRSGLPLADRMAFVTYAARSTQSGWLMHGYKQGQRGEQWQRMVQLVVFELVRHRPCLERLAGVPLTGWATVPSLPAKPTQHPLNVLVDGLVTSIPQVHLVAAKAVEDPRALDTGHFSVVEQLGLGSHVLLIDDTWARGGHFQSAAGALRQAGARQVSGFVVARWLDLKWLPTPEFVRTWLRKDFDPDGCPWTGGTCP